MRELPGFWVHDDQTAVLAAGHWASFNKAYWGSAFEYCVHDVRGGVFCDVAGGSLTHVPVWRVLYVRFVTGPISRIFSSPTCSSWLGRRSQRTNRH